MSGEMLYVFDKNGVCTYVSPAYLAFLGKTLEEMQGSGWVECIHPDDREIALKQTIAAIQAKSCYRGGGRGRRADGVWVKAVTSGVPLLSPVDRSFMGHIGIVVPMEGPLVAHELYPLGEPMPLLPIEREQQQGALRAYELVQAAQKSLIDPDDAVTLAFELLLKVLLRLPGGTADTLN